MPHALTSCAQIERLRLRASDAEAKTTRVEADLSAELRAASDRERRHAVTLAEAGGW